MKKLYEKIINKILGRVNSSESVVTKLPANPNYSAVVVKVRSITTLNNCDNVVSVPLLGYSAIVSKDIQVGDVGIVFPPETQLSEEFCYENNLFRHNEKNKDVESKGYLEDTRRVKAIRFRGNTSNALFMRLDSLKFTGVDPSALSEGTEFDTLNDHEICKKYEIVRKLPNNQQPKVRISRVDAKHMPEHFDTENYFRWSDTIVPEKQVIVTQKLHGSSIRVGNTIVKRKLNLVEKTLDALGVKVVPTEYDYIYASRKVIKDPNNPFQNDFYDNDIWTDEGKKLRGRLPENYIVYGELIGWTSSGMPIQKDYSYGLPKGTAELYIYRVAVVNNQGLLTELSWDHVMEFCSANGLKHVPEIWRGLHKDFDVKKYMDVRLAEMYKGLVSVPQGFVDEGVCVRIDTRQPLIYKAKSPIFLEHESKMLDENVIDLEATQTEDAV
jgi:hypothetical protein